LAGSRWTFAEWDACAADDGCGGYKPVDHGWGRGDRPVINVSWDDAKAYLAWLSKKTGEEYRLLSEAEREYVARAGTTTPFWWGQTITRDRANYDFSKTLPVKSFQPNPWGLYQVHGNVDEWVEDCRNDWWVKDSQPADYNDAPADGSPWLAGKCASRATRGGSWYYRDARSMRAASRDACGHGCRNEIIGFRCARVLR
jgi:formylglycine-generating enzyme required for sulfatase activity